MGRVCGNDSDCAPGACPCDLPNHCDFDSGAKEGIECYDDSTCAPGTCIDADHWEPCPICNPATNKCNGGPNDCQDCEPPTPDFGSPFPTSQDCPPWPTQYSSTTHMPYPLTTADSILQADDGQFCGYCRDVNAEGSYCHEGDPDRNLGPGVKGRPDSSIISDCRPYGYHHGLPGGIISGCGPLAMIPCDSDADCYTPCETCEQRDPGAFGRPEATYIYTFATPAGGHQGPRSQHAVTLSGVFCTPATPSIAGPTGGPARSW